MKVLKLNKYQVLSLYNLLLMNLKITASYFVPFGIMVLAGSWLEVHRSDLLPFSNISGVSIIVITLGYIAYISLFCFIVNAIIHALPVWHTLRSLFYTFVNLILLLWMMVEFSEANQWELLDKKGGYSESSFTFLFFWAFILISVFWAVRNQRVDYNKEYSQSAYKCALSNLILVAVHVFLLILSIGVFRGFDYLFESRAFSKSILLNDKLICWTGTATGILLLFTFYRKLNFRFRVLSYVALFTIVALFFWVQYDKHPWDKQVHTYREILIYYNPLWLDEESRGHTEFDI